MRNDPAGIKQNWRSSGFTLIEMLVVLALIGLITVFALPNISSMFKLSLNSVTRELASTVKEAYNSSIMTGRVYRLAYDLKEQTFWVESGPGNVLLDTKDSKEKENRRKRFQKPDDAPPAPQFTMDTTVTRKKMSLPRGVVYEDVITEQSPDPITEGMAYTHIFPHGLTERTIIHLKDTQEHHISLLLDPVIGTTHMVERYVKEGDDLGN